MRGKHVAPHWSLWGWAKVTLGVTGLVLWSIIAALLLVFIVIVVTLEATK